jgi:hypothetical protein
MYVYLQRFYSFVMPVYLYYIYVKTFDCISDCPFFSIGRTSKIWSLCHMAICVLCRVYMLCVLGILSVCPYGLDMFFISGFESTTCLASIPEWTFVAF